MGTICCRIFDGRERAEDKIIKKNNLGNGGTFFIDLGGQPFRILKYIYIKNRIVAKFFESFGHPPTNTRSSAPACRAPRQTLSEDLQP
jgi:hypothetical protein